MYLEEMIQKQLNVTFITQINLSDAKLVIYQDLKEKGYEKGLSILLAVMKRTHVLGEWGGQTSGRPAESRQRLSRVDPLLEKDSVLDKTLVVPTGPFPLPDPTCRLSRPTYLSFSQNPVRSV